MVNMEKRQEWIKAKAQLELVQAKIHAVTRPFRQSLHEAQEALAVIEDGMPEHLSSCEVCDCHIFEGDKHTRSVEGVYLCEQHSPLLSELIKNWEEAFDADPQCWFDFEYDSADEWLSQLTSFKDELANEGDRPLASA